MPSAAAAATCTWTGGGADALWSTAANWTGCAGPGIPQNGDDLIFPAAAAQPVNENDLAGLTLTSIVINGTGAGNARYSISGLGVTLTGAAGLLFNSPNGAGGLAARFLAPITLGANVTIAATGTGGGDAEAGAIELTADSVFETLSSGAQLTVTGAVTGEFALTVRGPGAVRLAAAANTNTFGNRFSPLTVETGALYTAPHTLDDDILVVVGDDATWYPESVETIGNIAGSGVINTRYQGQVTASGNYPSEYSGAIVSLFNGGPFGRFVIATELTLGPGGNITGSWNLVTGTLRMNTPHIDEVGLSGGVLDLNGATRHVNLLRGAGIVELGASTLQLDSGEYAGTLRDLGQGGGLTKVGTGTLRLLPGADLAYSRPTVVEDGPLLVDATIPGKAVQINGGWLGGSGAIGPVTATGGAINPGGINGLGNPGTGFLRTGDLELSPAASVRLDFGPGPPYADPIHDRLIVSGTVNLAGAALVLAQAPAGVDAYPASALVIDNDGADPIAGTFAGVPEGTVLIVERGGERGAAYRVSYVGGDGNDVVITKEPTLCTWTGAFSADWQHQQNWSGCAGTRPFNGDALVFPAGAANPTHSSGLFGLKLASIDILGAGAGNARYDIGGQNRVTFSVAGLRFNAPADASGAGPRFLPEIYLETSAAITNEGSATATVDDIYLNQPVTLTLNASTAPIDVTGEIRSVGGNVIKTGAAPVFFRAQNGYFGTTEINAGTLVVNGTQQPHVEIRVSGGVLSGTGTVGNIWTVTGAVNPGPLASGAPLDSIGTLHSGRVTMSATSVFIAEVDGESHDRLVTSYVTLQGGELQTAGALTPGFAAVIIQNDGNEPTYGTFNGLPEGAMVVSGGAAFRISYVGGDGNDVQLTGLEVPTYLLAEGATGTFFDYDLSIANPNLAEAPIVVTFFTREGQTIVEQRTVPAQSRLTLRADDIQGLEQTEASAQVVSTHTLPLAVARTMFWDATGYGGHTAEAVNEASPQWYFAEGSQGFFQTYFLAVNPGAEPADVTFTFLRENEAPVIATRTVAPHGRLTLYAGDIPELIDRSFGVSVLATRPVVVERAMYFASAPGRLWQGGTGSIGVAAPATHWSFAEGATGTFFDTYLLLANPSADPIDATVTFLSGTGQTHAITRTVPAQGRRTLGLDDELTGVLPAGAVASVVDAPQPLIAERSMYWPGDASPWGEAHNSFGITAPGLHWGLAEGRLGGPRQMSTYILLANSGTEQADVTVTFLRETGAPVVRTYSVAPNTRYNVDVAADAPELNDSSFGADIRVMNGAPITVECSMYWNANGVFWAGGSNAPATRLP